MTTMTTKEFAEEIIRKLTRSNKPFVYRTEDPAINEVRAIQLARSKLKAAGYNTVIAESSPFSYKTSYGSERIPYKLSLLIV